MNKNEYMNKNIWTGYIKYQIHRFDIKSIIIFKLDINL